MLPTTLTPENVYSAYRNWMLSNSSERQFGPHWVRSVGLRFDVDTELGVGDDCHLSYDSNDQQLNGTCAFFLPLITEGDTFEDVQMAIETAILRFNHHAYRVVLVAGTGHEDGEWQGEIVIENAVIAAIFE